MTIDPDDRHDPALRDPPPRRWDPLADHPVGPDDLGNVVIHVVQVLGDRWRRLRTKLSRR